MNKKILIAIMTIGLVAMLAGTGIFAYFSDVETSTGNTFTAGKLDLVLDMWDGTEYVEYNGKNMQVFDVEDVKPGDSGEVTISLHVIDNDAWIWVDFSIRVDSENGLTEPEGAMGDTGPEGELAENMDILVWWDIGTNLVWDGLTDVEEGDNIWQDPEPIFYKGKQSDAPTGPSEKFIIVGCETVYMGIAWSVDKTVGNIIQSDRLVTDMTFYVEQLRNNP